MSPSPCRALFIAGLLLLAEMSVPRPAIGQGGVLDALRSDVRGLPSVSEDSGNTPDADYRDEQPRRRRHADTSYDCDDDGIPFWAVELSGYAVTSPLWVPHVYLHDDFQIDGFFPRFPYDAHSGYLMTGSACVAGQSCGVQTPGCEPADLWPSKPRRWAARLSADYADQFTDTSRIGGSLLLSTTSRWGLDAEMGRFEEDLPAGGQDRLWLGDCNLVYRFAQSERAEFRAGVGFNWLDDTAQTDFGVNFTYAADFFVGKPWVVSSVLDWGTLGDAELFRFRATVGLMVRRVETYTGYEYLDIGSTQMNALVAGIRIWF